MSCLGAKINPKSTFALKNNLKPVFNHILFIEKKKLKTDFCLLNSNIIILLDSVLYRKTVF